eukprot:TCONS_00069218-protein
MKAWSIAIVIKCFARNVSLGWIARVAVKIKIKMLTNCTNEGCKERPTRSNQLYTIQLNVQTMDAIKSIRNLLQSNTKGNACIVWRLVSDVVINTRCWIWQNTRINAYLSNFLV